MSESEEITIKSIVKMGEDNERLEKYMNFLKEENFDYAMKCNSMKNAITNMEAVIRQNPKKLSEASDNMCEILAACRCSGAMDDAGGPPEAQAMATPTRLSQSFSPKASPSGKSHRKSNKAHVVKPHMVNGTILYIPTINLTRVSDLHHVKDKKKEKESPRNGDDDSSLETNDNGESDENMAGTSHETEPGASSSGIQGFENQVNHGEDISEAAASMSPAHSTVLSGTFQEVKIFLNQVSADSVQEHSRKPRKRCSSKNLGSSPKKTRSSCFVNKKRRS